MVLILLWELTNNPISPKPFLLGIAKFLINWFQEKLPFGGIF